ncbi:uncharacterized protein V1516DRAFT_673473 [Lipomyces oligophaga]|uniref:uncharacterized protein n=1 Tax=Lipomyces oligophaga TaxID=45792 RepID=UPI0034CD850B
MSLRLLISRPLRTNIGSITQSPCWRRPPFLIPSKLIVPSSYSGFRNYARLPPFQHHQHHPSTSPPSTPSPPPPKPSPFEESNPDDAYLLSYDSLNESSPKPAYAVFLVRFILASVAMSAIFLYSSIFAVLAAYDHSPYLSSIMRSSPAPVTATLLAANVLLFGLKRGVPALTPALVRFGYLRLDILSATHRISTRLSPALSIFLSSFSHRNFPHILLNGVAFYSFGSYIEVLDGWPTLLILAAASISGSAIGSLVLQRAHAPSIGASGVCMGFLSYLAMRQPDMDLSIMFIPFIRLSIGMGTLGMTAWSVYGVARTWISRGTVSNMLDHGGHLGGLIMGYGVYKWQHGNEKPVRRRNINPYPYSF